MRFPKKRILAGTLLFLIFGTMLFIAWLGNTQQGLNLVVSRLHNWLPAFQVEKAEGQLFSHFSLHNIHFHTQQLDVKIERFRLQWHFSSLFKEEFKVESLAIATGQISIAKSEQEESEKSDQQDVDIEAILDKLDLPLVVTLEESHISDIQINVESTPVLSLHEAELRNLDWREAISLEKFTFDSNVLQAEGGFSVEHKRPYHVEGEINARYSAEGIAPVKGRVTLAGVSSDADLSLHIEPPYKLTSKLNVKRKMFDKPQFSLEVLLNETRLNEISSQFPGAEISGQLSASGKLDDIEFGSELSFVTEGEQQVPSKKENSKQEKSKQQEQQKKDQQKKETKIYFTSNGSLQDIQYVNIRTASLTLDELAELKLNGEVDLKSLAVDVKGNWSGFERLASYFENLSPDLYSSVNMLPNQLQEKIAMRWDGDFSLKGNKEKVRLLANTHLYMNNGIVEENTSEVGTNAHVNANLNAKINNNTRENVGVKQTTPTEKTLATLQSSPATKPDRGNMLLDAMVFNFMQSEQLRAEFALDWENIVIPLNHRIYNFEKGRVEASGDIQEFSFKGDADSRVYNNTSVNLNFAGDFVSSKINVHSLKIASPAGNLNGMATINIEEGVHSFVDVQAREINPGLIAPEWQGDLDMDLKAHIRYQEALALELEKIDISGRLRDRKFASAAKLTYANDIVDIDEFKITSNQSRIQLTGGLSIFNSSKQALHWEMNVATLEDFFPDSAGQIISQGRISDSFMNPSLAAELSVSELQSQALSIDSLKLNTALNSPVNLAKPLGGANFALDDLNSKLEINLQGEAIRIGDTLIQHAEFSSEGRLSEHTSTLIIQAQEALAKIELNGAFYEKGWRFELSQSEIKYQDLPAWKLKAPMNGDIGSETFDISPSCWQSMGNVMNKESLEKIDDVERAQNLVRTDPQVCLAASIENKSVKKSSADSIKLSAKLEQLPIAYFSSLLPETLDVDSYINGEAEVNLLDKGLHSATVELRTSEGSITWNDMALSSESNIAQAGKSEGNKQDDINQEENKNTIAETDQSKKSQQRDNYRLGIGEGYFHFHLKDQLSTEFLLPMEGSQQLEFTLQSENTSTQISQQAVKGAVKVNIVQLGMITDFVPSISRIDGEFHGQIDITGTLSEPQFSGDIRLQDGMLVSEEFGIEWKNVKAQLNSLSKEGIQYSLSASSGEGIIEAIGKADYSTNEMSTELKIQGNNFRLVNTEELRLAVSPVIDLSLQNKTLRMTGELVVESGAFSPKQLPKGAVTVSDDQILISENGVVEKDSGIKRYIDIRVKIADSVKVDAFGFKGGIGGAVNVKQSPSQPITASGQLNVVNGEFRAYGQGLVVDYGKIIFAGGPIDRPGIDIKAHRKPEENIIVGVFVQGYLGNTEFQIFSDPSDMSETEQLSWLVLGKPLQSNSDEEKDMLSEAALSLSINRADSLLKKLSGEVGVDTIGIATGSGEAGAASDTDQAKLVLGKYLTPDLFVSYGIGLFDAVNTLKVEYIFNKNWKVATERSSDYTGGGDIIYSREKM